MLVEAPDTASERHTNRFKLMVRRWGIGRNTNPENQPTLRDLINRCRVVRKHDRVAQHRQQDCGAKLSSFGTGSNRCQHRQRLVAGAGNDRVTYPD